MFRNDLFESHTFQIEEASTEVDGKHVIGKLKGPFFVPDGISRNNRFYPKELWEKQLSKPEIQKRMSDRRMFGTISHTQPIDDTALLEGKISHIVTKLDANGGIGEALILDTPAGRILNTFARAGVKLFVSSRANGAFKGEENGIPRVDPETYDLQGFDVVIDPGFLQANPKLVESLNESIEKLLEFENKTNIVNNNSEEDFTMKELLESLSKENGSLKIQLSQATTELTTLKNENTVLADENKHIKDKFAKLEEQVTTLSASVKKYEDLGKVEDIDKALTLADAKLRKFEAICAKPEELSNTLAQLKAKLEEYVKIGTPAKINEALDKAITAVKSYSSLGTPAEIDEALDRGIEQLTEYKKYGSTKELATLFEKLEKNATQIRESKDKAAISALAAKLKVTEDAVKQLWDNKMTEAQIVEFFAKLNTAPAPAPVTEPKADPAATKVVEKFIKKNVNESAQPKTTETAPVEENMFQKSRGARLIEHFSK